jgi:hypothetical protein
MVSSTVSHEVNSYEGVNVEYVIVVSAYRSILSSRIITNKDTKKK